MPTHKFVFTVLFIFIFRYIPIHNLVGIKFALSSLVSSFTIR